MKTIDSPSPFRMPEISKADNLRAALAITLKIKQAIRQPFAWPGGYPISVWMTDGTSFCIDCTRKNWRRICESTIKNQSDGWKAWGTDILWEGNNRCDECGKCLDAYGEE